MENRLEIIDKILKELVNDANILTKEDFHKLKNIIYKEYKLPQALSSIAFLERYNELILE